MDILSRLFTSKAEEGKEKKLDAATIEKQKKRAETASVAPNLSEQFTSGRLYACISSRPGQCGRADGYILEGPELDFYARKMAKKKSEKKDKA